MTECHLHPRFFILDSTPRSVWSCMLSLKAKARLDFSRFKGSSALLLLSNANAPAVLTPPIFFVTVQIQKKRSRRASRLFQMVKGSWKLYFCSHRNLIDIVWIPAAASEAGEGCSVGLAGEQQRKGCSERLLGGIFLGRWMDPSLGKKKMPVMSPQLQKLLCRSQEN